MMRKCPPNVSTEVASTGTGPALTVVVAEQASAPAGWIIDLYADLGDPSNVFVTRFTLTAPAAITSAIRVVGLVTVPGARGYRAVVHPPVPNPTDPIQVGLLSDVITAIGVIPISP